MIDFLRPFIARVIAPIVTSIIAYIGVHYGIAYDPGLATKQVTEAVIIVFGVMSPLAGVIKQIIEKKVNPGNAASSKLAAIEHQEEKNPLIQPGVPRRDYVRTK